MRRTLFAAAALPLLVLAGPALSQQTNANLAALTEVDDDDRIVEQFNLTVDQIEDMKLVGANGEEIGEIEEVLMDADGQVVALSAEVGGTLGVGDKDVILQLDQVRHEGERFVIEMTQEEVEALPEWHD